MRLLFLRARPQDRERAIEILATLEQRLPQDPELMQLRALQMLEQPTAESRKAAREKLESVIRLEPTAASAHLALINLAMQEGEYQAARDYAVRALGSNANNLALLSARGRTELALGNTQMAIELARLVFRQDPNSIEATEVLVQAALNEPERGLLEEACSSIESAVGRNPANERLLVWCAHVLVLLGQPQKAIPKLEAYCGTKEGAGSVTALVTLADLYRLAGDVDRSRQWIEQAQRLDANHQAVIHARLLWVASQNRFEELKGISSAYLAAKEQDPTMLVRAASILVASNSAELKKEGLKLFEHAATLSPTSVDVRLGLASALYQTGDVDRAENIYREVLAQPPANVRDSVRALNDLAWILQEHSQRYDAALELANKGLGLARDDRNLLDTRGTILMNLPNRLAEAKNDFAIHANLLPEKTAEKAKAFLRLGRICAQLHEFTQAKQYLQAALDIDRQINVFTEAERSEIANIMKQSGP
jgi:tetratricopeptide (TPR) repeat protein